MHVEYITLVELFEELGFADAQNWGPRQMYSKIKKLKQLTKAKPDDYLSHRLGHVSKELIRAHNQNVRIEIFQGIKRMATNDRKRQTKKQTKKSDDTAEPRPAMIKRVIELLSEATQKTALTKQEILDVLIQEYPENYTTADMAHAIKRGMANTLSINVPTIIRKKYDLDVRSVPPQKTGKQYMAYFIPGRKITART